MRAYAPYSAFHVGCAVASVDGEIVTGANMENACYRLGLCAEQSALAAAAHAFGLGRIARIAVAGGPKADGKLGDSGICTPCGGCRQAILEAAQLAGRDIEVVCAGASGDEFRTYRVSQLIPDGFGPHNLC